MQHEHIEKSLKIFKFFDDNRLFEDAKEYYNNLENEMTQHHKYKTRGEMFEAENVHIELCFFTN